jgi:GTP diphosphokinase / guanosine-3',5'-bis(diphosphate) 3'-diphosphatase
MFWPLKKKSSDLNNIDSQMVKSNLENLIKSCREKLITCDEDILTKAFYFCVEAFRNKENKSGEPYYVHSYKVAQLVIDEIPLDQVSVICALLHDIPEASDVYKLKDIHSEFGQTIYEIVEGIYKIQHIEDQNMESGENFRKLLLSLFKDVRIILIKTADILCKLKEEDEYDIEERIRLAHEAVEIYSPFVHRLGLGSIKGELEDLSFSITNPDDYNEIKSKIKMTEAEKEKYIKDFTAPIREKLDNDQLFKSNNITYELKGRAKRIYSIYNKIKIRKLSLEKLYDLFAIRIIIDSDNINYCYLAYGIISDLYELVPGTFKNYIANPKINGYQSIHAVFYGAKKKPVEVQIRTKTMHKMSEKGLASHFNYKRGLLPAQSVLDEANTEEWLNLVRSVFEKVGQKHTDELLDSIKKNWHQDEIYVFTPAKEFKVMPKNATPLDFAYAIHSEVGEHCIGAKVNGKVVPLDYKLLSGDQVEILTSRQQKPTKDWMEIVVTQKARNYIQKYLRDVTLVAEEKGRYMWEEFLEKIDFNISEKKFHKIIKALNYESKEDFFTALSTSGIEEDMIFDYIREILQNIKHRKNKKNESKKNESVKSQLPERQDKDTAKFSGLKFYHNVIFAECCQPVRDDKINGVLMGEQKTVTIHRSNCRKFKEIKKHSGNLIVNLDWDDFSKKEFLTTLKLTGTEKTVIFSEITTALSNFKDINIQSINFKNTDKGTEGMISLSVKDLDSLNSIIKHLKTIPNLTAVERYLE